MQYKELIERIKQVALERQPQLEPEIAESDTAIELMLPRVMDVLIRNIVRDDRQLHAMRKTHTIALAQEESVELLPSVSGINGYIREEYVESMAIEGDPTASYEPNLMVYKEKLPYTSWRQEPNVTLVIGQNELTSPSVTGFTTADIGAYVRYEASGVVVLDSIITSIDTGFAPTPSAVVTDAPIANHAGVTISIYRLKTNHLYNYCGMFHFSRGKFYYHPAQAHPQVSDSITLNCITVPELPSDLTTELDWPQLFTQQLIMFCSAMLVKEIPLQGVVLDMPSVSRNN